MMMMMMMLHPAPHHHPNPSPLPLKPHPLHLTIAIKTSTDWWHQCSVLKLKWLVPSTMAVKVWTPCWAMQRPSTYLRRIQAPANHAASHDFLEYFTWYLSRDVWGAFLVWAITLTHGFSSALLKMADKTPWYIKSSVCYHTSMPSSLCLRKFPCLSSTRKLALIFTRKTDGSRFEN